MSKRKRGRAIHGWICLDKPLGLGSTPAVSKIRHAFNAQKAKARQHKPEWVQASKHLRYG